MDINGRIEDIKKQVNEKLDQVKTSQELQDLKVKFLGKKSELSEMLKQLGNLTKEERPKVGALVNKAKNDIENKISNVEEKFKEEILKRKLEKEKIDITLPGAKVKRGSKHPLNRVIEEIEDLFVSMGYDVVERTRA